MERPVSSVHVPLGRRGTSVSNVCLFVYLFIYLIYHSLQCEGKSPMRHTKA